MVLLHLSVKKSPLALLLNLLDDNILRAILIGRIVGIGCVHMYVSIILFNILFRFLYDSINISL